MGDRFSISLRQAATMGWSGERAGLDDIPPSYGSGVRFAIPVGAELPHSDASCRLPRASYAFSMVREIPSVGDLRCKSEITDAGIEEGDSIDWRSNDHGLHFAPLKRERRDRVPV